MASWMTLLPPSISSLSWLNGLIAVSRRGVVCRVSETPEFFVAHPLSLALLGCPHSGQLLSCGLVPSAVWPPPLLLGQRPKPTVKVQPAERVFIRERVTLTCDIESGGVWSYEWFKNNDPLSEAQWRKNYEISNADGSHEGNYTCKGRQSTEPRYSEISAAVRLTVSGECVVFPTLFLPLTVKRVEFLDGFHFVVLPQPMQCRPSPLELCVVYPGQPEFPHPSLALHVQLLQMQSIIACEKPKPTPRVDPHTTVYTGDTLTLTCDLQISLTGWRFTWYKVSQQLKPMTEYKDTNTLSITASDTGTAEYQCVALRGDYVSHYSAPVRITVRERPKATMKVQPAERVFIRERVTLTCDIESGGVWSYEWFKNNDPLSEAQRRKNYEISNVDGSHEGDYTCKGRRSTEPRYSEISAAKPTLRVDPHTTVYTGDTLTLTCDLQISLTGWRFSWYKDSQQLNPLTEYKDTNTLSITVSDTGTGVYQCIALRGDYVSHYSAPVRITVRERPKPTVKVQPAERVFIRERVTLTCDIESGGVWSYEWFKNNDPLSEAQWRKNYEISNVDGSHEGNYTCKGRRSTEPRYSEISAAVRLTVSDSGSMFVTVGVAVGCSLMVLLIITLCLVWCYKKNKGLK
ncbi:leukocyte immunoglobulin-like receptor subfamily A member 3 [Salminus brasiliensis]|uniref:leukocyte immunoglobulin-like receptor subfamily A member 3 n=1 Tax=Salminus brasiliensis TaxID=930266 RepID=UPI003B8362EA